MDHCVMCRKMFVCIFTASNDIALHGPRVIYIKSVLGRRSHVMNVIHSSALNDKFGLFIQSFDVSIQLEQSVNEDELPYDCSETSAQAQFHFIHSSHRYGRYDDLYTVCNASRRMSDRIRSEPIPESNAVGAEKG